MTGGRGDGAGSARPIAQVVYGMDARFGSKDDQQRNEGQAEGAARPVPGCHQQQTGRESEQERERRRRGRCGSQPGVDRIERGRGIDHGGDDPGGMGVRDQRDEQAHQRDEGEHGDTSAHGGHCIRPTALTQAWFQAV